MQRLLLTATLASLLLAACGGREVLAPLPSMAPPGVSLAGTWRLRGDAAEIERRINAAIRQTDGVEDRVRLPARPQQQTQRMRRGDGRVKGGLVYVFFENGETLRISQTPDGLFVNFDRSVVEEYRFGEHREINVGQASAQRVSGWDGRDYVIETLDRNGMKLTERYQLSDDGDALTRRITFRGSDGESVTVTQLFRRG